MDLRQYLSCEKDINKRPFSSNDIQWISDVLGLPNGFDEYQLEVLQDLSFVDIEACPGSGKTTVLVAKLALLSRYWNRKDKGICVLSMTNAAREEIQQKLGKTFEGKALFQPPHFIGTIDSFVGKFLARPWLNKHGMWVERIDDDFCAAERLRVLQLSKFEALTDYMVKQQIEKRKEALNSKKHTKKYKKAKKWLEDHDGLSEEEKRLRVPVKNWMITDESFNVIASYPGSKKPLDYPENMVKLVSKCLKSVAQKGIYTYSDIFVFAQAQIKNHLQTYTIIRNRFPVLFIDEAQDTSKSQAELLYDLFIDKKKSNVYTIRQRYGDVNQTIYSFEPPLESGHVDFYPQKNNKLSIPKSHRFDQSIANIVRPFEIVTPDTKTIGSRKLTELDSDNGRKHSIIFFDKKTRQNVIPSFLKYVEEQLSSNELIDANLHVCSHIHKKNDKEITEKIFARTISDYYPNYAGDKITKDYKEHEYLIDYFRHGSFLSTEKEYLKIGIEKISDGILRATYICKESCTENIDESSFYHKIRTSKNKYREISKCLLSSEDVLEKFHKLIRKLLISKVDIKSESEWQSYKNDIKLVIRELLSVKESPPMTDRFFEWNDPEDFSSNSEKKLIKPMTTYTHKFSNISKKIKLGTIHSVKGQTHTATLLLEANYMSKPVIGKLKKIFLGEELASSLSDSELKKSKTREHINTLYVGMTRPSHLLVLALPINDWEYNEILTLKKRGWQPIRIKYDGSLDYIIES